MEMSPTTNSPARGGTGPGRRRRLALLAAASVVLAIGLALPAGVSAGKKKQKEEHYALLVGSVFTAEGYSLPGVRVSIKRKGDRKPHWHAESDHRGEFAVRLPSGPATYEVTTESKNRVNETKSVEFKDEERVDVFFRLALKDKPEEKSQ